MQQPYAHFDHENAEFSKNIVSIHPFNPPAETLKLIHSTIETQFPLDRQLSNFYRWAEDKLHHHSNDYLSKTQLTAAVPPAPKRLAENNQTLALYKETFGEFFWSGIECSNPQCPQGGRWDQLALAGVYSPSERRRQIRKLNELGIENIRLGMPNHKMVEQKSWDGFSRILRDFKNHGIKVSLDLLHFGLPTSFRNESNPEKSIFLNPAWPEHFVRFSMSAVKRYSDDLEAITIINEPLITNKFSSLLWNEGFPGDYSAPLYNHFFIRRALYIADAAVTTRHRIEEYLQDQGRRMIFIHNESCEYQPDHPEFNNYLRFLASDMILGHEWLMNDDHSDLDMREWLYQHYIRPGYESKDRAELDKALATLRQKHQAFEDQFGKTMRADTVFGIDYYLACESVQHGFEYELPTDLKGYERAVYKNQRRGLARITTDYWNRYQLPILHTETNFADEGADEWGIKQLVELAQLPKLGIPILGFTWYSLMDQFNWDNALKGSPQDTRIYPVGLLSLPDYQPRHFTERVLPELLQALHQ